MKMPKRIAAIILTLTIFFVEARFASFGCTSLSAWFPDLRYDVWALWIIPLFFVLFIYHPVYDLLSFATYKLGYEPTFDEALLYPEDSTVPVSMRHKLFGYPFMLAIMSAFAAAWAKIVYCG